jgi:hypothetical protein
VVTHATVIYYYSIWTSSRKEGNEMECEATDASQYLLKRV